ncbi:sodium-translocating pyrophosphatase [Marispirochaeta aestuarii]|uniref:Putative K(+)-stimulated pyrophosphate-energized sodium pump n=1 Tax=Marispirochaeta aestuarii TaxID=1963862 RepID=A0A1Y1S122_9SPIO|nr:sodium-translocating pyrophosphatase [Marispirochaeta aestuarii]ORC36218.1 sodium-translocating pyrophosphatase [Marispirochaeta aestuarii]
MDVNILACALFAVLIMSLVSLIYGIYKTRWIFRQPVENEKLLRISGYVSNGAMTFLGREYRVLIPFVLMVAVFLALANRGQLGFQALTFTLGAACSALAGFIGMKVATASNARTTSAAEKGLAPALLLSFTGGSVMGLSVVGLALLGLFAVLSAVIIIFTGRQTQAMTDIGLPLLTGFSMGASSIALFTRVGGGIYTKAADIGADLVGKLEANIPEDDPRNPATIADNVGDNVGDVAGMGADLFESYVGTIVGCIILGQTAIVSPEIRTELVALPLLLSALGVVGSIIGIRLVGRGSGISPQASLNRGSYTAALIAALGAYPLFWYILGDHRVGQAGFNQIYLSFIVGLVAGVGIGMLTEYFTGMNRGPVNAIVKACETGPATTIITGIGIGMRSSFLTILIISAVLMLSYLMAGLYGLGISALGMLCTLGIQLAVDAYGPIADNAGGLAEMAELPPEVRSVTDRLDAVGNTTAAIGKGFAIGSAALTAVILFVAFKEQAGIESIDLTDPTVLVGLFLGAAIPYLFSSMAMGAIGRAAFAMIQEVRRQFREKPGILSGKDAPDYNRCIDISTSSALTEMVAPGLVAALAPIAVGFLGGTRMLMGLLAGTTVSGVILSIFMANSGGAWDNAKKSIEEGASEGKGSASHKASIVGDTVGDPFKDTAGPSLNILIKMMAIISLVIAPLLKSYWN